MSSQLDTFFIQIAEKVESKTKPVLADRQLKKQVLNGLLPFAQSLKTGVELVKGVYIDETSSQDYPALMISFNNSTFVMIRCMAAVQPGGIGMINWNIEVKYTFRDEVAGGSQQGNVTITDTQNPMPVMTAYQEVYPLIVEAVGTGIANVKLYPSGK